MPGAVLLVGALAFGTASLVAGGIALAGVDLLIGLLPPLAIDADALRGAIVAMAAGLGLAAAAHAALLAGVRRGSHRARSAALLLTALLASAAVVLGAAALTAAVDQPAAVLPLGAAGLGSLLVAVAYGVAAHRLVAQIRSGAGA